MSVCQHYRPVHEWEIQQAEMPCLLPRSVLLLPLTWSWNSVIPCLSTPMLPSQAGCRMEEFTWAKNEWLHFPRVLAQHTFITSFLRRTFLLFEKILPKVPFALLWLAFGQFCIPFGCACSSTISIKSAVVSSCCFKVSSYWYFSFIALRQFEWNMGLWECVTTVSPKGHILAAAQSKGTVYNFGVEELCFSILSFLNSKSEGRALFGFLVYSQGLNQDPAHTRQSCVCWMNTSVTCLWNKVARLQGWAPGVHFHFSR